ncbi:metallophosphoesterase family protein [Devosia submarina]|uniref:metallophosphoesterase family protein n=1 Tax=Devosia submarina TaxID=1173082 RepID=UPI00130069E7|nr:metallophosphoesterase family protein [Devosia submarina]
MVSAFETHLSIPSWPAAIYAIGDVHGCLEQLQRIEQCILADSDAPPGDKLLVMLGDYVDRGPQSAGVIDHLLRPAPAGFSRVLLAGNHEEMMLNALLGAGDEGWLEFGGMETVRSYGADADLFRSLAPKARQRMLQSLVPQEHVGFLTSLAVTLQVEQTVFVHAGIRRNIPLEQQDRSDLMWIRREFLEAAPVDGLLVVHGHTPVEEPEIAQGRIGIDTGAFATGRLTAVRLSKGQAPAFFTTGV